MMPQAKQVQPVLYRCRGCRLGPQFQSLTADSFHHHDCDHRKRDWHTVIVMTAIVFVVEYGLV